MGLTDDSRAAYRQIAEDLRTAILDGRLSPGDQLPTTTELMATIEDVPYDQILDVSVVATNCFDSGLPTSFEGTMSYS